jgi:hypothetical protein
MYVVAGATGNTGITGKPVAVQQGTEDAMVPALMAAGMNRRWAELYQETFHALNNGHIAWQGGQARFVRGTTEIDVVLSKLVKG